MNENVGKKRDWIKNAVIVFLIIMLLLTFFSNSIMNYSLPEVSAEYVSSGTIQAKVRGNGTVHAGDPYVVTADSDRNIESVAVRNGDRVEKGQVLFFLKEGDSAELKEAQKTLDQMISAYRQSALTAELDSKTVDQILNGQFTNYNTYKQQVETLRSEIEKMDADIASYEAEIDKVKELKREAENETSASSTEKRLAYEASVSARANAEAVYKNALAASGAANAAEAQTKQTEAQNAVKEAQKTVSDMKGSLEYEQAETVRAGYESKVASAKAELEQVIASGAGKEEVVVNEATGEKKTKQQLAQEAWDGAVNELAAHKESSIYINLAQAEETIEQEQEKADLFGAVVTANNDLTAAKNAEQAALKAYEAAGPDHSTAIAQYQRVIDINEEYVQNQKAIRDSKEAEITTILTQMTTESTLSAELQNIQDQRELVEELREKSQGGNIIAPTSGTVQDIVLTAGTTTIRGEQVATIVPDGTEYTMEVSVTRDQAQRLNVGDVADVQNAWYYSDVKCVLQQIRTDKTDPSTKRILVFKVEGSVSDGQSLSISIGQKSANYDAIVPNSAVREDNNGKFVLVVSQKSSPLGNRYYAERVDVEVLASDDTKSAVSGELGYAYVITTSTKPVEAGQLIRLAD